MATVRTGGLLGGEVEIYGLDSLLARLHRLSPQLDAELVEQINAVAGEIADEARARIHYRTGRAFRGYQVQRKANLVKVRNATAGGQISEFAGSANPGGLTPRGATLIRTLNAAYGKPGRLVWSAWDERKDDQTAKLAALVEAAEARLRSA